MGLSLGVLLADDGAESVARAVEELRGRGDAQLFLMDDGVLAAGDPRVLGLLDEGVEVSLCAMDAEARGVSATGGGPRFGSQYDHAVMVREAARVVAITGALPSESRPAPGRRTVLVRLTRDARHPKTAQALRSAVGYAAASLDVVVVADPAARAILAHQDHPPALLRALATLRALGHSILDGDPPRADVEVRW